MDFGQVAYDGSQPVSIDLSYSDARLSQVSWFDNEINTKMYPKVFCSITNIPEKKMEAGSIDITLGSENIPGACVGAWPTEYYDSKRDTRWEYNSDTWQRGDAPKAHTRRISFNGDKQQITGIVDVNKVPGAQAIYDNHRVTDKYFTMTFTNYKLNIPAGCQEGRVTLSMNWDIESSP